MFNMNGGAAPQVEQLVKMQQGMLEQAEAFTRHWIERRQEAVETAIEALNGMNSDGKPDPAAAMRAITDWQRGSFERLTADYQEWMKLCMQATQLAASEHIEADQESADSSGSDQNKTTGKSKGAAAPARSRSQHATPV
ncbi:phasin family protein [Roseinatronobacter sp.]|uniref:phasin family protein n=1 Tax=Roseinatronobacter sp. TaxID=1945755 RepID=UPI0025E44507|nr:phasin family protein [Roseibaca sp.]